MADTTACKHTRTQVIAHDAEARYVECLDCGAIFDETELDGGKSEEPAGENESLSDA